MGIFLGTRSIRRGTARGFACCLLLCFCLFASVACGQGTSNSPITNVTVLFLGFTATHETFDHQLEVDGKGDEVYLATTTIRKDAEGAISTVDGSRPFVIILSGIMGDVNAHPERQQCGSAAGGMGGIRSGDSCPSSEPWIYDLADVNGYDPDNSHSGKRPPMIVSEFLLQEGAGSVIVHPVLWEWDGGGARDVRWEDGSVTEAVTTETPPSPPTNDYDECADWRRSNPPSPDTVVYGCFSASDIEQAWEALKGLFSFGRAEDRPIGLHGTNKDPSFTVNYLDLDYAGARELANTDAGHGVGVVPIRFQEFGEEDWIGDYTLYLKIEVN